MKKGILLLFAFTLPLLTMGVGCNLPPATATPIVVEPVDTAAEWKEYANKELGFKLAIPADVNVDKVFNDKDNRLVVFKGDKENFEVRIIKDSFTTLDKYYYLGFPVSSKSTLGGNEAMVYEAPQGYCDGPGCSSAFIAYSTKNGDNFYNLVFNEVKIINATEKNIISSFEFIPLVQAVKN